mgnify:FL=1
MTLPTETKTSIDNQDITSSEQPIIIQNQVINQNEHQPPFTTATDKNYDDSHPVDKKNNQMESVPADIGVVLDVLPDHDAVPTTPIQTPNSPATSVDSHSNI